MSNPTADRIDEALNALHTLDTRDASAAIEIVKATYLSKRGLIKALYDTLKTLPAEEKKTVGEKINLLKVAVEDKITILETQLQPLTPQTTATVDITRQAYPISVGTIHPVNLIINKVIDIFQGLGFDIINDQEIDTEENCFDKLRIPAWHPARDTQDTFYLNGFPHTLLRTHTTATQPKILSTRKPPLNILSVGKVFRSDEIDATHTPMFHQVDGFMVAEHLNFAHLKGVLEVFIRDFLPDVKALRFRPHYFSYTEPSLELDVSCYLCEGQGCKGCKNQGWIELLGAGMMHPELFEMAGYEVGKYTGFAFGFGVERIVMQRYGIQDIRDLYANDLRLLKQIIR